MESLMPASLIATFFFGVAAIQYPTELKQFLFFEHTQTKGDIVACVIAGFLLVGTVNFVICILRVI